MATPAPQRSAWSRRATTTKRPATPGSPRSADSIAMTSATRANAVAEAPAAFGANAPHASWKTIIQVTEGW
jgi:hypothetical protein